ncbi:hypothetical protein A2763_03055 [Candidatus Kaiserbacteria bacterium RIFCSPHIGHO2_01_FULL_54_36]|uniref:Uncharacterized protein n=1 Tax=Candidatus Kaiserbacteria bacterium RIFCSPHIGHO2_01_FULL_54_36 TaxID=1798482 RepID=A0A1F6CK47_9BACT|nr:MAG: hypothetical protein A2763_03055 [Candidatus Kaiserbacteria bacterium RIFCSPHIGHO2_01_FULL_54_36]
MASRRKKKAFRFTSSSAIALAAVFVVSFTIGSLSMSTASRSSQLAVAKEADAKCTPDKDYTYPCDKINPKTKKKGGLDCSCPDFTNGHETPGKCKGPNICKGEPPGGGKPPEMPKMPEPKKDEKPPEQPKTEPCPASGSTRSSAFSGESDPNALGPDGKPCPSSLGSTLISNLLDTTLVPITDETTEDTTTTEAPKSPFSWFAVGRVIQDVAKSASEAVGNVFSNSSATLQSGETERPVLYPTQEMVALQAQGAGQSGPAGGTANQASFYTNPDFNTFGGPAPTPSASPQPRGFWDGIAQALKNFLGI